MDKSIEAAAFEAAEQAFSASMCAYETCMNEPAALRAAIAAYRDAEIERLTAELAKKDDHFMNSQLREHIVKLCDENDALRAKLEAAERDASQLREAASAMLDKIDYNINNERLPLTYTVPWEQAVALRRAVRKETAIDAARGGEHG